MRRLFFDEYPGGPVKKLGPDEPVDHRIRKAQGCRQRADRGIAINVEALTRRQAIGEDVGGRFLIVVLDEAAPHRALDFKQRRHG